MVSAFFSCWSFEPDGVGFKEEFQKNVTIMREFYLEGISTDFSFDKKVWPFIAISVEIIGPFLSHKF